MIKKIEFWPDYVGSGWTAVEEGYDAEPDGETGRLCSKSPIGRGKTSREAIQDLLDQLEDQI